MLANFTCLHATGVLPAFISNVTYSVSVLITSRLLQDKQYIRSCCILPGGRTMIVGGEMDKLALYDLEVGFLARPIILFSPMPYQTCAVIQCLFIWLLDRTANLSVFYSSSPPCPQHIMLYLSWTHSLKFSAWNKQNMFGAWPLANIAVADICTWKYIITWGVCVAVLDMMS